MMRSNVEHDLRCILKPLHLGDIGVAFTWSSHGGGYQQLSSGVGGPKVPSVYVVVTTKKRPKTPKFIPLRRDIDPFLIFSRVHS